MLYSAEQILTEFEKILYQELTVIKKIAIFNYRAIYYIEKKNIRNIGDNYLQLFISISLPDNNSQKINIFIDIETSRSYKKIFTYQYYYDENEIEEFFITARQLLQLINSKLSNTKIRSFYYKEGLLSSTTLAVIIKKIINNDLRNQKFDRYNENKIISSKLYIRNRLQTLIFKITQLVKKYIKEEYKDKIYLEKDFIYIKMLDTGKVTLNLHLSYDYYNQYPRNYITIRLAIKWFTNLNIKRIPYDKTIMFTLDVNIIPTPNEEEILDRLVKKTIIVFNEIDDYIKLQK